MFHSGQFRCLLFVDHLHVYTLRRSHARLITLRAREIRGKSKRHKN